MTLPLARWSPRRIGALWGAGLLLEAVLLLIMFGLLEAPEPPLVARLRGDTITGGVVTFSVDTLRLSASGPLQAAPGPPAAAEDSFYTVLHWPYARPARSCYGRRRLPATTWRWSRPSS